MQLLRLHGNGIDQGPARICSQRGLQHFHMAGIQGEGQAGDTADLLHRTQHHGLLVDTAHAHIDVQDRRSVLLLFLRKLQYPVGYTLPQLTLQQFFSGGVDSFSYDQKAAVQLKANRPALRGQVPDTRLPPCNLTGNLPAEGIPKLPDVFRRCAAAASQNGGSGLRQLFHLLRKFRRSQIVACPALLVQKGKARIWLCDNGEFCGPCHGGDNLPHPGRTCGTVDSYGAGAKALQNHRRRLRIRAVKRPSVPLKGHGHHHRKITYLLCGNQRRPGFPQAHHGFYCQQIHARPAQGQNLLLVNGNQLLRFHVSHRLQLGPGHGEISCHIDEPPGTGSRLPGNFRQPAHHVLQFVL